MKQTVLFSLILCLSQPSLAMAQVDWEDVYLKLGVGLASWQAADGTIGDLQNPPYDEVEFDGESSPSYQLGIGYKLDSYLTMELSLQQTSGFELEGPYVDNGTPVAGENGMVDLQTTALMISCLVDMASILEQDWQLRPYIGLGLGYAKNKLDTFTWSSSDIGYIKGNTKNIFAWKAILGATYPITDHFVFDVSYAYADYGEAESGRTATDLNGTPVILKSPLTFDVNTQEVFIAARYLF